MVARLQKKPKGSYHHPGLADALVDAALRTIREHGIDALNLRDIGTKLGVSRTAIYRHFEDKSALLARVALEGFSIFRQALRSAVDDARTRRADPVEEIGAAYIKFAMANQSHYLVMFGGDFGPWERYPDLTTEATAAFEVLLNTITEEQSASRIAADYDPLQLAQICWAEVHGIATLGMTGRLNHPGASGTSPEDLSRLHARVLTAGLRAL